MRQSSLLLKETAFSPEQQLAAAVFSCAITDATNPRLSAEDRQSAVRLLLENSYVFTFWATERRMIESSRFRTRDASST